MGDSEVRQAYHDALVDYFTPVKDQLSEDSQRRLGKNPLRILDSKAEEDQQFLSEAPKIRDYLDEESKENFNKILASLDKLGVKYVIDDDLVRGLDYYTGTVYETTMLDHPEIGSICSGGRYDNLAEFYTDKQLPGVGISIGLTRLFYVLGEQGYLNDKMNRAPADVLILPMTDDMGAAIALATSLRDAGIRTQLYSEQKKFKHKIGLRRQAGHFRFGYLSSARMKLTRAWSLSRIWRAASRSRFSLDEAAKLIREGLCQEERGARSFCDKIISF